MVRHLHLIVEIHSVTIDHYGPNCQVALSTTPPPPPPPPPQKKKKKNDFFVFFKNNLPCNFMLNFY